MLGGPFLKYFASDSYNRFNRNSVLTHFHPSLMLHMVSKPIHIAATCWGPNLKGLRLMDLMRKNELCCICEGRLWDSLSQTPSGAMPDPKTPLFSFLVCCCTCLHMWQTPRMADLLLDDPGRVCWALACNLLIPEGDSFAPSMHISWGAMNSSLFGCKEVAAVLPNFLWSSVPGLFIVPLSLSNSLSCLPFFLIFPSSHNLVWEQVSHNYFQSQFVWHCQPILSQTVGFVTLLPENFLYTLCVPCSSVFFENVCMSHPITIAAALFFLSSDFAQLIWLSSNTAFRYATPWRFILLSKGSFPSGARWKSHADRFLEWCSFANIWENRQPDSAVQVALNKEETTSVKLLIMINF